MREQKRRKQFQSRANTDGYYTDRDTMDELEEFDGERRIQWIPMIVGFAGIIIFAVILISFSLLSCNSVFRGIRLLYWRIPLFYFQEEVYLP